MADGEAGFRSGFACFVGRPNAGKSTLLNALVGSKVAITADQPQTTRRAIRGIVHRPDAQLVIVDTPGLHRPRTLLGERLNDLVRGTLAEVDVIGFCLPANEKIGPGDRFIAEEVGRGKSPVVAIVTKIDLVKPAALAEHLLAVDALGDWEGIVPVSAVEGTRVDALADVLVSHLPPGPALYPDGDLTDEPENVLIAELVREAALEGAREELPHSLAVVVEEVAERDGTGGSNHDPAQLPLMDVRVTLFVERDSQKGIVIGHRGERLKEIGSVARKGIEALLGRRVFLDIRVKVAKNWQRDPKQLGRLGF
ncbi:MAG: GTPase Era [Demequinaceae bacterium]|nr:GTPase Era [Demequinaceae bacterium]